jgi:hypothetical protein
MAKRKREVRTGAPAGGEDTVSRELEGESDMPLAPPPPRKEKPAPSPDAARPRVGRGEAFSLSTAAKENILLAILSLYVLLLAFGTAGELFEVDWILGLPLFK